MICLSNILREFLSDSADSRCCLCFETITETEGTYFIDDLVLIGLDIETSEILYEVISMVLGDKVLDSISAHSKICQKCKEMLVNSYKFIHQCKNNIDKLYNIIESLQNHMGSVNEEALDYKSLFVALDTSNYNVNVYYDKHRNCNNQTLLCKRFQRIQKDSLDFYIEFEREPSPIASVHTLKQRKKNRKLPSIKLSDIALDKNDLNNLKCKTCLKLYPTAMKLKQHYARVHGPKDFKCSQCPRSFGTSLLLKQHKKHSHCDVVCSHCGKTYTNIYSLRHHERSHKLRLVCQTCGKVYKGKQAFNNHIEQKLCQKMRKSNAEATLSCDYCGKRYSQKTALSVHIRLEHEDGKALTCDWCGKKLSSMSRLKDHILKHTKQKNFECEQCGGKFVSKTSLLYHTRRHTGEKPYKCEYCDMTFISASRRSEHVKRHHTQTNLECDICHGKFKGNTCLVRHRRKHFDITSRLYVNPSNAVLPLK